MKNLHELDKYRIPHPIWPQTENSGAFRIPVGCQALTAMASVDDDGEHVSITLEPTDLFPAPDELNSVITLFFAPDENGVQIHYGHPAGKPCRSIHIVRPTIRSASPATTSMETLAERDKRLESLWETLADVPMDPDTECMEDDFLHFPSGTSREEIWKWFDERHSRGVAHLLYRDGIDRTDDMARLYHSRLLCDECESQDCAYNRDGVCRFPMVYERRPNITEDDGCTEFVIPWPAGDTEGRCAE